MRAVWTLNMPLPICYQTTQWIEEGLFSRTDFRAQEWQLESETADPYTTAGSEINQYHIVA